MKAFLRAFKTYPYTYDLKERLLSSTSSSPATSDFTKIFLVVSHLSTPPSAFRLLSYLAPYSFISSKVAEASYLQGPPDFQLLSSTWLVFISEPARAPKTDDFPKQAHSYGCVQVHTIPWAPDILHLFLCYLIKHLVNWHLLGITLNMLRLLQKQEIILKLWFCNFYNELLGDTPHNWSIQIHIFRGEVFLYLL